MATVATLVPSAKRLMGSLRDLGYELPAAVADLVDNSIEAGATDVDLHFEFDGDNSYIRITDNGAGMDAATLLEAMRYGSEREHEEDDLGKYGLGLKTASMSQCRRLTVATRTSDRGKVAICQWDLDHVENVNRWEVKRLSPEEAPEAATEPLNGRSGTVVLWESLDRLSKYKSRESAWADRAFRALWRETEQHLAMVFNRFLSSEKGKTPRLRLRINSNPIPAWDPFVLDEKETRVLEARTLHCRCNGKQHDILVRPHILPNRSDFSSAAAAERASGPRKWNEQQGFYFYRSDRLIQAGGWSGVRTRDEHTKLARVGVFFRPSADCCFGINVAKMRVTPAQELWPQLEAIAADVAARARKIYDNDADRSADGGSSGASPSRSGRSGGGTTGRRADPGAETLSVEDRVRGILEKELKRHPDLLRRVLAALARISPAFAPARRS